MILIAAVDDGNGMTFNNRRQSQDRVLRERILSLADKSSLWMNSYSERQFAQDGEIPGNIKTDEQFLEKAQDGDYCFDENLSVLPYKDKTEKIILFKWNRSYPGDLKFDIDVQNGEWKLESSEDFKGFSHEKITMEVYSRNE